MPITTRQLETSKIALFIFKQNEYSTGRWTSQDSANHTPYICDESYTRFQIDLKHSDNSNI